MAHLSKAGAYAIFAAVLVAYTVQCELASFLHRSGYSKPFFMLYLTHSSYTLIGIMHYGALRLLRIPLDPLLDEARRAVKDQLLGGPSLAVDRQPFPTREAARRLLSLTVLIALPAGIWYSSISLTSMTSLTALYNLNAFWAYILSIYYARSERWELRSAVSVGIACLGVLIMTYGDSGSSPSSEAAVEASASASAHPAEVEGNTQGSLLGDLLGLLSSLACGFYEVWYKRYIALPTGTSSLPMTPTQGSYSRLATPGEGARLSTSSRDADDDVLDEIESELREGRPHLAGRHQHQRKDELRDSDGDYDGGEADAASPPSPGGSSSSSGTSASLFLFHANLVTACVGLLTIVLLWLPIPFLHWSGVEPFALPRSLGEWLAVSGVCFAGVIFNSGFMVLISNWGPVVTSVGNLFTLILVAAADEAIALVNGYSSLSVSTLAGSGFILAAFGLLVSAPGEGAHKEANPKGAHIGENVRRGVETVVDRLRGSASRSQVDLAAEESGHVRR